MLRHDLQVEHLRALRLELVQHLALGAPSLPRDERVPESIHRSQEIQNSGSVPLVPARHEANLEPDPGQNVRQGHGPLAAPPAVHQHARVLLLVLEVRVEDLPEILRHERRAEFFCEEWRLLLVYGPDPRSLLVVQHRG